MTTNDAWGVTLDAYSVRAEIDEAPASHDLTPEQAAAIAALDDATIGQALQGAVTDDLFWHAYDTTRRDAIAALRRLVVDSGAAPEVSPDDEDEDEEDRDADD